MSHVLAQLRSAAARHVRVWTRREDGAITVDYVVLSAAVIGLGIAMHAVLDDPLAEVAGAVEGELSETDTTDEAGGYRPFDPTTWESLLATTRESWGSTISSMSTTITVFAPYSAPDEVYVDFGTGNWYLYGGDPNAEFDFSLLAPTSKSPSDYTGGEQMQIDVDETVTSGPGAAEVHDAMRGLLTEDQYSVLIGQEDRYAALQIVMEESGYDLPDDWPDFRSF